MAETAQTTMTRMYANIRDQLASEITAGVYPADALLPSIREIMSRWEVSTTAGKVLDELAAAGYARKEGTCGHISTGGPPGWPAPSAGEPARKAPPPDAVPGRLTIWPVHTIPVHRSIGPDADNGLAALDVRAERPPSDAAVALGISDPSRQVIVRRRLGAAPDDTPSSSASAMSRPSWPWAPNRGASRTAGPGPIAALPRPAERCRHRAGHGTALRRSGTRSSDGLQLMAAGLPRARRQLHPQLWLGWFQPGSTHGR